MGSGLEPLVGLLRFVHRVNVRVVFELTCRVQAVEELAETCRS